MLTTSPDHPIHHPANPDKFEFDDEVTQIFDDMAKRSIPMYDEARRLTAQLAYNEYLIAREEGRTYNVLDIGASTGAFFKEIWDMAGVPITEPLEGFKGYAVELSEPMFKVLQKDLPYVTVHLEDALMIDNLHLYCDAVNMAYVAQFIEHEYREELYRKIFRVLKPTGMLFMSKKDEVAGPFAEYYTERYMEFRRANGYTQEEIDAKTKALKGAMWCELPEITQMKLQSVGFRTLVEVCRWLQFSTVIAYK